MEVLGITSVAISIATLVSQFTEVCYRYRQYTNLKELEKLTVELNSTRQRLDGLFQTFGPHDEESQAYTSDFTTITESLTGLNGPFKTLVSEITDLHDRVVADKWGATDTYSSKRWPLSTTTTQRFIERIEACNRIFDLALKQTRDETAPLVEEQLERVAKLRSEEQIEDNNYKRLNQWIAAPDPYPNHAAASKIRQPSTGSWFVDGTEFNNWLSISGYTLWLYGNPGCGKTILCSTAIDKVLSCSAPDQSITVAYFYFKFQDQRESSSDSLVRSLIQQLSLKNKGRSKDLEKLFKDCEHGQRQPSFYELQDTLYGILRQLPVVYIIVDAVDECSESEAMIRFLYDLGRSSIQNLHLMATNRPQKPLFDSSFDKRYAIMVSMSVDTTDLKLFIKQTLYNDNKLQIWPKDVLGEIETTLGNGGDGLFRWVHCQLDSLRRCKKVSDIRRALISLPKTLDETYERTLNSIAEDSKEDALTLLQWLTYSSRPLRIEEIAEVLAIEDPQRPRLNPENRLVDPRHTLNICSDLVTVTTNQDFAEDGQLHEFEVLQFAHFSVKEYLTSDRCCMGICAKFSIQPTVNNKIAESCIGYLFSISVQDLLEDDFHKRFPLSRYASREWPYHVNKSQQQEGIDRLDQMIDKLLNPSGSQVMKWLRMYDPDKRWSVCLNAHKMRREVCSDLYYASSLGLLRTVKRLLKQGADVNQIGGSYGSALQAAAYHGHEDIVVTLMENDANCMIRGGHYGTALQAAKFAQHESIVKILEEHHGSEMSQDQLPSHIQLLKVEKEPFEVIDKIGGGGSGIVEKVRILSDGRICVRKTCRTPNQATKKRFFEEVRIMQKLHHTHVVKVLNSYSRDKTSSILLLPLADMDLADFIEGLKEGQLAKQEREKKAILLVQWTLCLAEGLRYIHSKNVKHKDIKPQNLLVHGKNILYTDFGIAHDFEGSVSVTAGNTGMTRRYSAPEVLAGNERSRSADVFSLGCVYLEMLEAIFKRSLLDDFDIEDDYATYFQENQYYNKKILEIAQNTVRISKTSSSGGALSPEDALPPEVSALTFKMLAASPQDRPKASQMVERLCSSSPEGINSCCYQASEV